MPTLLYAQVPEAFLARSNAVFNAQALDHSKRCYDALMGWRTPPSGLLYDTPSDKVWRVNNSAADLYPFMVLNALFTDPAGYAGPMLDILNTEIGLTSRDLGDGQRIMPDDWDVTLNAFNFSSADADRQTYGTTEYMKDGIMPITEWLGPSTPWFSRMTTMMDYMWTSQANLLTDQGAYIPRCNPDSYNVANLEIHGEHLQVLLRLYWQSGQQKYLDWAIRIGDQYLLGPHHITDGLSSLRLRDHGNELTGGLSELYATLSQVNPAKAAEYRTPLYRAFDRILAVGRNADGLFYNSINPQTGAILDTNLADTFGYVYNGFYTVYLTDKDSADPMNRAKAASYRDAVTMVLTNIDKPAYHNFTWEPGWTADGYADAIEGALNLFNRERLSATEHWLDTEVRVFWGIQRTDGFANEVYADGNFIRTTLMFALWKSRGVRAEPWVSGLSVGSTEKDGGLYMVVQAPTNGWTGKLKFDHIRHTEYLHLPFDWPRINQFPEWFTADGSKRYRVVNVGSGATADYSGEQLQDGVGVIIPPGAAPEMDLTIQEVVSGVASNRPPVLEPLADLSATPGATVSIAPLAADPDGGTMTFSAGNLAAGLTMNPATGSITGTLATNTAPGTFPMCVTVTDPSGLGSSQTFLFTVQASPGSTPLLFSPTNAVAEHNRLNTDIAGTNGASRNTINGSGFPGGIIDLNANPTGALGEILARMWYVKGSEQGSAVAPPQSIFYDLGTVKEVSGIALWLEETDPNIGWPTMVIIEALSDSITSTGFNLTNLEAQAWTTVLAETPVDTNKFTGQVFAFPSGIQTRYLRLRMTASYTPPYGGTNLLAWGFNEFAALLGNLETNHPPAMSSLAARVTAAGAPVNFPVTAVDPDPCDTLTYSATGLPSGVTINPAAGTVSGAPTTNANCAVVVTAVDSHGAKAASAFQWTVYPGTRPELISWVTGGTDPALIILLDHQLPMVRVRFPRAVAAALMNVSLEQSVNLKDWIVCNPVTVVDSNPTTDILEFQLPLAGTEAAKFFRLRIAAP